MFGVEHAKQESRDDGVETVIGEIHLRHIPFLEIDRRAELIPAPPGTVQHGRAEVDAGYFGAIRVVGKITPGADSSIKQIAFQSIKQNLAHGLVTDSLKRQIEDVIKPGDAVVSFLFAYKSLLGPILYT